MKMFQTFRLYNTCIKYKIEIETLELLNKYSKMNDSNVNMKFVPGESTFNHHKKMRSKINEIAQMTQ